MWILGVEHDSIFVHNEKWPPQQVQLPSVTMKVTKKFFFPYDESSQNPPLGNRSEWFLVNAFRMTNAINLDFFKPAVIFNNVFLQWELKLLI